MKRICIFLVLLSTLCTQHTRAQECDVDAEFPALHTSLTDLLDTACTLTGDASQNFQSMCDILQTLENSPTSTVGPQVTCPVVTISNADASAGNIDLDVAGTTYVLTEDILSSNEIRIEADNITLDLCGRHAQGGIRTNVSNLDNITVRNGLISSPSSSAFFTSGSGHTNLILEDLTIPQSTSGGGIAVFNTTKVRISRCTVCNISGSLSPGILLSNSSLIQIDECHVRDCSFTGISLQTCTDAQISNCKAQNLLGVLSNGIGIEFTSSNILVCNCFVNNAQRGIDSSTSANSNIAIDQCIITNCRQNGMDVNGNNITISNCTLTNNAFGGLNINNCNNFKILCCEVSNTNQNISISSNASGGLIKGCLIANATDTGMFVFGDNVCIVDNVVKNNGDGAFDDGIRLLSGAVNCVVQRNHLAGNSVSRGISDQGAAGDNLVIQNTAKNNSTDYTLPTTPGFAAFPAGNPDPWDNITL